MFLSNRNQFFLARTNHFSWVIRKIFFFTQSEYIWKINNNNKKIPSPLKCLYSYKHSITHVHTCTLAHLHIQRSEYFKVEIINVFINFETSYKNLLKILNDFEPIFFHYFSQHAPKETHAFIFRAFTLDETPPLIQKIISGGDQGFICHIG